MVNICNHFYTLLGQANASIQPEHEKRIRYSKLLLRYAESPTTVGNEIMSISTDEADREVVDALNKELNSVWSKDVGLLGLRDYLIDKLYNLGSESMSLEWRFAPISYLVSYSKAMNGTLNAVREANIFTNSKEFLTPGDDNENIMKFNKIKECVCENGFEDAISNNNLGLLFVNIDAFIKSLATEESVSKFEDMYQKVKNEQLFNFGCEIDVFKDEFKMIDVMAEKVNNDAIAGTTSIIKFMEGECSPDHLSTLKAVMNAQATFAANQNKIAETCKEKINKTIALLNDLEASYNHLYGEYEGHVKQFVMNTFGQENNEGSVLNASVVSLSNRVVRLDNYLLQIFYQAHLELTDAVMHVIHFNTIKRLMEGISKLK